MNKEAITYYQENPGSNEPKDVKIARFSRKLDVVQIAGGLAVTGVGLVAAPALVVPALIFSGANVAEMAATSGYIKVREHFIHKKNKSSIENSRQLNFPILRDMKLQKAA